MAVDKHIGAAANSRLHAVIRGHVQAVGFREFATREAQGLGLKGYVRNFPDGTVEVQAEGPPPTLELLLQALRRGPAGAQVEGVEVSWARAQGDFARWEVRR
ncbi:MAG: acylphosphatase [Candidatus Dormibacteria bacterium]